MKRPVFCFHQRWRLTCLTHSLLLEALLIKVHTIEDDTLLKYVVSLRPSYLVCKVLFDVMNTCWFKQVANVYDGRVLIQIFFGGNLLSTACYIVFKQEAVSSTQLLIHVNTL